MGWEVLSRLGLLPLRIRAGCYGDVAVAEDLAEALTEEQDEVVETVSRLFRVGDVVEWRDASRRLHAGKVVDGEVLGRCKFSCHS